MNREMLCIKKKILIVNLIVKFLKIVLLNQISKGIKYDYNTYLLIIEL